MKTMAFGGRARHLELAPFPPKQLTCQTARGCRRGFRGLHVRPQNNGSTWFTDCFCLNALYLYRHTMIHNIVANLVQHLFGVAPNGHKSFPHLLAAHGAFDARSVHPLVVVQDAPVSAQRHNVADRGEQARVLRRRLSCSDHIALQHWPRAQAWYERSTIHHRHGRTA